MYLVSLFLRLETSVTWIQLFNIWVISFDFSIIDLHYIMVIVGEKEVENKTVTVRRRFIKEQKEMSLNDFSDEILSEIKERRVSN